MTAEWILLGFVIGFIPATTLAGLAMAIITRDGTVNMLIFPAGIAGGIVGAIIVAVVGAPFPFNGGTQPGSVEHASAAAHAPTEHTHAVAAGGDGKAVFLSLPCKACHTIDSLKSQGVNGAVGPNLTHIGTDAATMKAGMNAEAYIRESIEKPGAAIAKGYVDDMPPALLTPGPNMDKLVAFLVALK